MLTAPVFAAGMALFPMVMIAVRLCTLRKRAGEKRIYRVIRRAGHACVKLDTRLRKRRLRPCADSAADQRLNAE